WRRVPTTAEPLDRAAILFPDRGCRSPVALPLRPRHTAHTLRRVRTRSNLRDQPRPLRMASIPPAAPYACSSSRTLVLVPSFRSRTAAQILARPENAEAGDARRTG